MSYSMSLNMHAKQGQTLKQSQRLIMSPQMQQALTLLQLPHMALEAAIDMELQSNPILEISETETRDEQYEAPAEQTEADTEINFEESSFEVLSHLDEEMTNHFAESGDWNGSAQEQAKLQTYLESSIRSEPSQFQDLLQQAFEVLSDDDERAIAEYLIGNLDDNGFFTTDLLEVSYLTGYQVEDIEAMLEVIQTLDPPGIGAKDIRSSLLIQLRQKRKKRSIAYQVVDLHYDDLINNRIPAIQSSLKCSREELVDAIESDILKLNVIPTHPSNQQPIQTVVPDVSVSNQNGELEVAIMDDRIPSLRLNSRYLRMLNQPETSAETKEYIKQKILSGTWLLKNISQRHDTLFRITEQLCTVQRDFLMNPSGKLQPLTMKEVSEKLELHESTVARAVANKYVETPRGILSLRSFFTNSLASDSGQAVSSTSVKDLVRDFITGEDKASPLSDDAISTLIQEKGVKCARRTVAKYRKEMHLGNASQRRRYG